MIFMHATFDKLGQYSLVENRFQFHMSRRDLADYTD